MTTYSVKQVALRYRVSVHTSLAWIRDGSLKAINVSRKMGGRPTWRVTEQALADFENLRSSTLPTEPTRRRRRRADEDPVIRRY